MPEDVQYHTAIIGKTGSGKSNILKSFMLNDVLHNNTNGFCLIDPHGELCDFIQKHIPENRKKDVVSVDLTNPNLELGYNPLKKVSKTKRGLVANALLDIFEGFGSSKDWGSKLSYILLNCIIALVDYPKESKLSDIIRLLRDKSFRQEVIKHIQNEEAKTFFKTQFKDFSPKYDFLPVYNKFRFLIHDAVRKLLVENDDVISLRKIMDDSKILLINCSKGVIGSDASKLIGSLFLSQLASAGFSRIDTPSEQRKPFMIYIDEAQVFASHGSSSVTSMLEELRKMKLYTVLSFQGITSLEQRVRDSVFANVGNLLLFRTSAQDGVYFSKEMAKDFKPFTYIDFVTLPRHHMIIRIMINGQPCLPFTATSIDYLKSI